MLFPILFALDEPQWKMTTYTFGFFVSGPNQAAGDPAELQRQQAEHIANLGRLAREGKLMMAGPLADPDRKLRGIIVLKGEKPPQTKEEMEAIFGPDPFVQSGRLAFESLAWVTADGRMNPKVDSTAIEEHTFVMLQKGDGKAGPEAGAGHMAGLERMWRGGMLALSGPVKGSESTAGLLVFYGTDREKIKAELAKDPMVKAGALTVKMMPLWLTKGALPEPGKEPGLTAMQP